MALPRRKRAFEKDGVTLTIAALTYNEMEAYAERVKACSLELEKVTVEEEIPDEINKKMRDNAFYVICCSLNGAGIEPELTSDVLFREMDDGLAGALVMEILKFNGFATPSEAQIAAALKRGRKAKDDPGETQASS